MLNIQTRELIKATIPALKQHGLDLTKHFYARTFRDNAELKEIFNQGHQRSGAQQQALAMSVLAYAEHIDDPIILMPVLERVAYKHISLGVRKEHYAIIGHHLLASIKEVLDEAATPAIIDAWNLAYTQLANILIDMEQDIYTKTALCNGGWTGWRICKVTNKILESDEITSFELQPTDGGAVPMYRPGQYVSVRVVIPELGYRQPRQYSLSDAPGKERLRISVKREVGKIKGMVSNYLHDYVSSGDLIEVSPPAGDFFLHEDRQGPVVLISAGVGITPMMSMLEHLHTNQSYRTIRFFHACRHASVQAFGQRVQEIVKSLPNASAWIAHEKSATTSNLMKSNAIGRLEISVLAQKGLIPNDADFYVCGPSSFMTTQIKALRNLGIPANKIYAEIFGTGGVMI